MRLCLIICAVVLAGCGPDPVPAVPPDMLQPCPGWQGRTPETAGELMRAAAAEQAGRRCANLKLHDVAMILGGPQ